MPAKAKRNSSNQLESLATPKKPIKPGAYGLRQDGSVLHATLPPGKPLVFLGEAVLHVMRGRALFNGATLGSGSVCSIAADAVNSGPLLISQAAEGNHFPFAPTASVLYLQLRPLPAEQRLSGGLGSTTAARMADDVGYQAWLHNDPSAPGCLATPDIWSQAVEEMAGLAYPGAVYAVVGSKKVGKSTLGRLLVNELLSTHNCGQPEFGPPGLVSLSLVSRPLTGPPFLHPAHPPLASYFVGDVSPASHPQRYAACVAALRAALGALAPDAPLLVNTHGWTRGAGLEALRDLLAAARPACGGALAHGAAPGDALAAAVPYEAAWDDLRLESLFTRPLAADQAARALNCSVVGLCCSGAPPGGGGGGGEADGGCRAAGTDGDGSEGARAQCASREDAVPLLAEAAVRAPRAPRTLLGPRCLGVGIVRAVDGERRRVLLLAPLPPAELAGVDTLQLGRLELPGPLLQTPGARAPYMSVHCLPTLGTGAGAIRSRNNLARARQADRGD
ncbi:Polynucleotide 5'-hydroxyl-kinase nol9 [Auxenochlorella protothecoides]|uniref:Polynucleotide 5'-hydroxyl-kinase nol9 n=1 Tax=Auxenochlorella protothecoides TaxID=3075 RepID=A0A087SIF9_AUXPR|nr:Polynucleotide 5'-hydroxyl-kinase nol9 [Auxenochlorella protothecoides]KFM25513.1 Polynucleotide 5'-hydroxyl-kinase nol9 [Auxenochlorella protothecoides]